MARGQFSRKDKSPDQTSDKGTEGVQAQDAEKPVSEEKVFSVEEKIKAIKKSEMPEEQKREYIATLTNAGSPPKDAVPLNVYFRLRRIVPAFHDSMRAYKNAKGVSVATPAQWDEIFKGF